MAEQNIAGKLEGQLDEILQMYDFAEKLHSYESLHGERVLNEDQRRRNMVSFASTQGLSGNFYGNAPWIGLATLYMWSRRGASSLVDLSKVRACGWTSASIFMLGTTFGCMLAMEGERARMNNNSQNP